MSNPQRFILGKTKLEPVPGELFSRVCPQNAEQSDDLFQNFKDEINEIIANARHIASENKSKILLYHGLNRVGDTNTHALVLVVWSVAQDGEEPLSIPWLFLTEDRLFEKTTERLGEIWNYCANEGAFLRPPWIKEGDWPELE